MTRLPDWLEPLFDATQMRATDVWAIDERQIPALELMERAGAGLAEIVEAVAPGGPVSVVCGKGNNGGDGLVAARLLRERGLEVEVLIADAPADLSGDALANLRRLPGGPPAEVGAGPRGDAAVIVDALLGTGSVGEPRGAVAAAIVAINAAAVPVVAADVPSGVDASTGEVAGVAVTAAATATFHAAKPGLWINPGKARAGALHVIDIGIPRGAPVTAAVGLIGAAVLDLVPRRDAASTKFTSGHVVVAGGSPGLTGAPCLAAVAAQRAGAGYVTVCVPASLSLVFESRLLEVMTRALPDKDGAHTLAGVDEALEACRRGGALVAGPGLGRSAGARAFARDLVRRASLPVVLDADGLNAHHADELTARERPLVATPHEGELARLLELEAAEISGARLRHARDAAARSGGIVVLKGDDTLVAAPDGRVGVSRGATAGLATAGTGDVLAGVIAALLAKGMEPFAATCASVLLHARAGARAVAERGADGLIASDVIEALPRALSG